MASLTLNYRLHRIKPSVTSGRNYSTVMNDVKQKTLSPPRLFSRGIRAFARRNKPKRPKKNIEILTEDDVLSRDGIELGEVSDDKAEKKDETVPSRTTVLKACTVTSASIAGLGVALRQASHFASMEGLPILDCASKPSFGFEIWHLELIAGIVAAISSLRYLLLMTWPDFAESSEAANQQVLSSLEPLDYLVVAFLPGISEEILFRGALLPLFGFDWKSVLFVASVFGVLHIGGGRKYSFAIWATFVGYVYGYATVASSSLIVPMASHAANNLIGGALWRFKDTSRAKEF